MNRQLSEEQLDNLMRTLVSDAAADDAVVNEIADSPAMWWGVQRQIIERKEARSPWPPPVAKFWRLLFVGVPVAAAAVLVISFFVMRPAVTVDDRANDVIAGNDLVAVVPVVETKKDDLPAAVTSKVDEDKTEFKTTAVKAVFVGPAKKRVARLVTAAVKKTEIKTDFIALSYGRNPESGQIVRVRVPSSMMVTAGLVPSVPRPTSMIDAEVIVGDDGMTHAIRFIR